MLWVENTKSLTVIPGVIYRGLRGQSPLLLKLLIILGGFAPQKFFYWICFSKSIDLAFKVFCIAMMNFALLYGY